MSSSFDYTTVEQQIQKLKSQYLSFVNETEAAELLKTYGYYNIINGYRDPYIIREYGNKIYQQNVSFEQLFCLFQFDHSIRDAVLLSTIDFEEHLRAVVANVIAKSFGSDYVQYLAPSHYRDRTVRDPKFRRNAILQSMKNVASTSLSEPIRYYREQHNIVPPWILMKGIYFGTLVNFIRIFKSGERELLITALYHIAPNTSQKDLNTLKDILADSLSILHEYRNLAAHGGRVYNYIPKATHRFLDAKKIHRGLPQLLAVLELLKYKAPYLRLEKSVNTALNDYGQYYPKDLSRIENATGLEIQITHPAWCNPKTRTYHTFPFCSGSKSLTKSTIEDAEKKGYVPCKRCVNAK